MIARTSTGNTPLPAPRRPFLEFGGKRFWVTVVTNDSTRMIVRFHAEVELTGTVRLGFFQQGRPEGAVNMLAEVVTTSRDHFGARVVLRYVALHAAAGPECLNEFLTTGLAHPRVPDDQFEAGRGGTYYWFTKRRRPEARRESPPPRLLVDRDARPKVGSAVSFSTPDGRIHDGRLCDVSVDGFMIATDTAEPEIGEMTNLVVQVEMPEPRSLHIVGVVRWLAPGTMYATKTCFGAELAEAGVPDHLAWREYARLEETLQKVRTGGSYPNTATANARITGSKL